VEKGPKEVTVEQGKAQGKKIDIRAEVGANSQRQQNQTVRFDKPNIQFLQDQFREEPQEQLCPGRHQHLIGVH
jgi:hypothetical protein